MAKVDQKSEYAILTKVNVAWYYTALKILALMTIVLPLVMLLAKVIARSQHKIVIVDANSPLLNKTRAAFELGSGETRLSVADVEIRTHQIAKILYQKAVKIDLRKDLSASSDGCLSPNIQQELISKIRIFQQEVTPYQSEEWSGIATSVFRTAKNGQAVLNRIKKETGVTVHLVSQKVEGELGFASAVAASKQSPETIISWDSGSGSFQLSTLIDNKVFVCGAEFAFVPALTELFSIRNVPFNKSISLNPITKEEALKLIEAIRKKLPPMPSWVTNTKKQIIGIDGRTSIFNLGKIATGHSPYTKEEVLEKTLEICGKTDAELQQFPLPEEAVVGLILL